MATVISGGRVVTACGVFPADVRVEGERITDVGLGIAREGDKIVPVAGKYILPGGIDVHTHFDLPIDSNTRTADSFATGTRAAIAGGTTTIIDYATQFKGETLEQGLDNWHRLADGSCSCDYGFHMAITDWSDRAAADIPKMVKAGVTSFKMYMAYKGVLQVDDGVIYNALKVLKENGGLLCVHCENGDIIAARAAELINSGKTAVRYHPLSRPEELETEAVNRLLVTAEMAEAPIYVVHTSAAASMKKITEAKGRGLRAYAETCPQYVYLDDSLYSKDCANPFEAAKYVCSPPLRSSSNFKGLWASMAADIADVVATDHCSFNLKGHKDRGRDNFTKIPNGMPGVETRMLLMYKGVADGYITLPQMVKLVSANPAKIFGMYPKKGCIAAGADADLVVLDPNCITEISASTQHQNVDYSPFEGFKIPCSIESVYLRGELLYSKGAFVTDERRGKFVARGKSGV